MIIYDSTSIAFIQKSEDMVKNILSELGFKVNRSRFEFNRYFYPIHIVVFEGKEWGHFNAPYFQIALNRRLIAVAKDSVLRDVLKHELAHYLTYIKYGAVTAHGPEFKQTCEEYGFSQEISAATMNMEVANESKVGDLVSERVIEKVKKLLQLAQSSNAHEAELATVKANQLLLRHNLDYLKEKDEPLYMDRILVQARKDAKLVAIYDILKHFIVRPVFSYGKKTCTLEVSGSFTNVTLARYVGEFLNRELDHLWAQAKAEYQFEGLRAKNSFFLGVAQGFDMKMKSSKASFSPEDQKALVVVEKKLSVDVKLIYKRLSSTSSGQRLDENATGAGIIMGKDLTIRQGVETKKSNTLLGWRQS